MAGEEGAEKKKLAPADKKHKSEMCMPDAISGISGAILGSLTAHNELLINGNCKKFLRAVSVTEVRSRPTGR